MSTGYSVYWGADNTIEVSAPDELDVVLDRIASEGPHIVDVVPDGNDDVGLQIGVGHPDRAVLLLFGTDGGYAHQPDLPLWADPIDFDYGGQATTYPSAHTRVTPLTARHATHEYLSTGAPPSGLLLDAGE